MNESERFDNYTLIPYVHRRECAGFVLREKPRRIAAQLKQVLVIQKKRVTPRGSDPLYTLLPGQMRDCKSESSQISAHCLRHVVSAYLRPQDWSQALRLSAIVQRCWLHSKGQCGRLWPDQSLLL